MNNTDLVFLDFDGVLCDSLPETFLSSWRAYYLLLRGENPKSIPLATYRQFRSLRPFIRVSADYLVIQEAIFRKIPVRNQAEFDGLSAGFSEKQMKRFDKLMGTARRFFLSHDRRAWLSLNPFFRELEEALRQAGRSKRLFILSTKKKRLIAKILAAHRVPFVRPNILFVEGERKLAVISRLLDRGRGRSAVLIDDQIDHLRENTDPRIRVYLASWGYVRKDWRIEIPALSITQASALTAGMRDGS